MPVNTVATTTTTVSDAPADVAPTNNGAFGSFSGLAASSDPPASHCLPTDGFGTRAIHAGSDFDPVTGAVVPALSLSTTYKQNGVGNFTFEYSRSDNPNRRNFEHAIASLENAKYALAFASGLAATTTVLNSLPHGSHIISVNDVYGGTYRYFNKIATNMKITTTFVDLADPANLRGAITSDSKLVWIETPTNPTLRLVDIATVARIAHEAGLYVIVDNTFLSPYFQNPLDLGADMVIHSVTKYLNGHSDVVMGVVATNDESIHSRLRFLQNSLGAVPSPFDCYQAHRGLRTLHLRMRQHAINAQAVAQALEASPYVDSVIYPGLASHPQHDLAKRQQRGFGGMVSFRIKGDVATADRFLRATRLFTLAESLGGVESLAELPALMTHGSVSPEDRAKLGITDNLIRLSVGVEETEDLLEDIHQALQKAVSGN